MKTEILLTFAVLLITAAPVWAIPSAGTYQWDSGGPLSGSFTSDGSALTTYEMASTTGPAIWTLLDNVIGNTTDSYVAFDTQLPGATADLLVIEWELNQTERTAISVEVGPQFSTIETFDVPFRL